MAAIIGDQKNPPKTKKTTNDLHYWLHLKKEVLHQVTAVMFTNKLLWSHLVLIKNPESATSETETRPSRNAFRDKTETLKSGLETKTDFEYYNTRFWCSLYM